MGFREKVVSTLFGSEFAAAVYGPPQSVGRENGWLVRMVGGKTNAGVQVGEHNARHYPIVYACVNRISNPVAHFPLRIMKPAKGGGVEEDASHPMSSRLKIRPNDFMSSRTLRKTAQGHALIWGNGYLEIERNQRGQAVGLWPLLPDRTSPRKSGDSLVYETTIDGARFTIPHGNVIHIMDQSQDGYLGLSQVAMARQAIGMGFAMEEFGGKFFANDAKSGGFLMHPGKLGPQAHQNLRGKDGQKAAPENPAAALEKQGGLDNAHRVKVLEEGMKWIQTTIPPEDAQFLGSREFQIAEIARIYDVPLILVQSHEKSTSWGTGIEQLMIGFIQMTVAPWIGAWEQELNWKLFTEEERAQGYHVKFNLNALLRGDMASRATFYKAMFELGMTMNQILALEDMNGIGPDGDVNFVSNNVQTIERAINPPEAPPIGQNGGPAIDEGEGE
ncbi:phage portal protein [Rhizobium binae]|uniref:phage portal protein n=1 Tax=Rhizobium binae TaxID=1138190 RepID=UPI001C829720|nr:phage portal protein [Rhizobium binae]MBX4944629.1 phage portal protein [Rhizobium binae]MBX4980660.1 phage portal protein [Rhizobium binae]